MTNRSTWRADGRSAEKDRRCSRKAGTHKSRILSATVYMADAGLKDEMDEAWMAWFYRSNLPTRTAVGAELTPGTMVEITICAAK